MWHAENQNLVTKMKVYLECCLKLEMTVIKIAFRYTCIYLMTDFYSYFYTVWWISPLLTDKGKSSFLSVICFLSSTLANIFFVSPNNVSSNFSSRFSRSSSFPIFTAVTGQGLIWEIDPDQKYRKTPNDCNSHEFFATIWHVATGSVKMGLKIDVSSKQLHNYTRY